MWRNRSSPANEFARRAIDFQQLEEQSSYLDVSIEKPSAPNSFGKLFEKPNNNHLLIYEVRGKGGRSEDGGGEGSPGEGKRKKENKYGAKGRTRALGPRKEGRARNSPYMGTRVRRPAGRTADRRIGPRGPTRDRHASVRPRRRPRDKRPRKSTGTHERGPGERQRREAGG